MKDVERFILSAMPLFFAMFCVTVISLLGDSAFIRVLLEIPVWAALLWWMWIGSKSDS